MQSNGSAIREIRERSGFTKIFVARAAGIHHTHYGRIESGQRNGTDAQIKAIAAAMKCDLTAIIKDASSDAA